jgi:hypothetical protein
MKGEPHKSRNSPDRLQGVLGFSKIFVDCNMRGKGAERRAAIAFLRGELGICSILHGDAPAGVVNARVNFLHLRIRDICCRDRSPYPMLHSDESHAISSRMGT